MRRTLERDEVFFKGFREGFVVRTDVGIPDTVLLYIVD